MELMQIEGVYEKDYRSHKINHSRSSLRDSERSGL